jgi:ABC-type glutathione transport system ATPase component
VTHDITLMKEVSDRVALLKEGRIVFVGGKDEISADMLDYLYQTGENNGL